MGQHEQEPTPVGGRRGYARTMTAIMIVATVLIILVAVVQWIRV